MKKLNLGTRWLAPKTCAYKSKIHGLGVKATKLIKKGEVIGVLGGFVVHRNKIKDYWKKEGHVGIQIHDDFYIVPPNRKELEKYGVYNHSCEPNSGFGNESIILYAIKVIKPKKEITFDYAFCELDKPPFVCNCGSKNCRKVIKPTDWKLPKLQQKYEKNFSPFVREKFR